MPGPWRCEEGEHPLDYPLLAPSVQARVDRVPGAEAAGQATPLATVLQDVEQRVEQGGVAHPHVAARARQAVLDALILFTAEFHRSSLRAEHGVDK